MDLSITHAKQEVDVIKKILDQSGYSESLNNISLFLHQFEGKHFRHLSTELLYSRVIEILGKLKKQSLVNNVDSTDSPISRDTIFRVNILCKESLLRHYRSDLENYIWKSEIQTNKMRGKLTGLDADTYSFHYTLPNGSVQTITLYSHRSKSKLTYELFKVLYEHWVQYGEEIISKSKIISELNRLGWDDVNEQKIEFCIANLKTKLIAPAKLSSYVQIIPARKMKGYSFKIKPE